MKHTPASHAGIRATGTVPPANELERMRNVLRAMVYYDGTDWRTAYVGDQVVTGLVSQFLTPEPKEQQS